MISCFKCVSAVLATTATAMTGDGGGTPRRAQFCSYESNDVQGRASCCLARDGRRRITAQDERTCSNDGCTNTYHAKCEAHFVCSLGFDVKQVSGSCLACTHRKYSKRECQVTRW